MTAIAGVILAGGRGERLGGIIKANIVLGGRTLLDRISERMALAAPLIVALGPHDPELLQLPQRATGIPDLPSDYAGPLAGVAAAVHWLATQPQRPTLLACAAVDSPFLPPDYLPTLQTLLANDAPAVIVRSRGQDYPTHSLWRFDAIAGLPQAVRAGTAPHSLRRLCASLGGVTADWPGEPDSDPFFGINTPEERAVAERRMSEAAD